MDFGVHLPHLGRSVSGAVLRDFAREIERLGCHSGWVSDHICWPASIASKYPYSDDGSFAPAPDMGWLDAISTLTYVAGCTERIRLAFTVLILPYRNPVVTAKQLASLDVLSSGRLILGCGVGWMREEAEALGMPWDHRGARSDEQLELFARLFNDPVPQFDGRYYQLPAVGFEPKPVQQPVPIWIGGASAAAFERVARFGHGFHAAFQDVATLRAEWQEVRRRTEAAGRDPDQLTLSLRWYLDPAGAMKPAVSLAGSHQQVADRLGELADIGVRCLVLDPVARGGVGGRLDAVREFMAAHGGR